MANKLDLSLVPGTPEEQRKQASDIMRHKGMPIEIAKVGSKYDVRVLGVSIGKVKTKALACSVAHQVGAYRLRLGDFVFTYAKGCK